MEESGGHVELECYPFTFSPLLLFSSDGYFDKGHSNYNSVAQFFSSCLEVDMLNNVLYDRKNMLYEELLEHVTENQMLVTCCIDAHFTAFQVLGKHSLIFYDPLKPSLGYISKPEEFKKFALFMMLKCGYGDNTHIQENKNHYTGDNSNPTRRTIYNLWRNINKIDGPDSLSEVRLKPLGLNLNRWLLINGRRDPRAMSTQLTGNTCYFQTFLFAVLCKVGCTELHGDLQSVDVRYPDKLRDATIAMSRLLLEFFVEHRSGGGAGAAAASAAKGPSSTLLLRPLSNCNLVCDFHRYRHASYFGVFTGYLEELGLPVPDYELQHSRTLQYYREAKMLHTYARCQLMGEVTSSLNTKSLQSVCQIEEGVFKLARSNYYKYRAANLMFGFNSNITGDIGCFAEFNSLRKNQLLAFYEELEPHVRQCVGAKRAINKYRDYYFMAQFEIGQRELVDLHHYTYEIDLVSMAGKKHFDDKAVLARVHAVNELLVGKTYFSTQKLPDYDKFLTLAKFQASKHYEFFLETFMSVAFFNEFVGLGLSPFVPAEKEVNALTQTAWYSVEMMSKQSWRQEYEFEKECINQMARSTLRSHQSTFGASQDLEQKYTIAIHVGQGHTYSKYNTLMHFLSLAEGYWHNPDLNATQVFGKDIRALLAISCQKIFFEPGHSYYHYGPIEAPSVGYGRNDMDLAVATSVGEAMPYVSREKRGSKHIVALTDRVYEYNYLRSLLVGLFSRALGVRFKSDDIVINLCLLSLLIDFGLAEDYASLLNLPLLQSLRAASGDGATSARGIRTGGASSSSRSSDGGGGAARSVDKRQLQVEVSNWINEFDKKNQADLVVTRLRVEELLFEASYKFIVNKNFSVNSKTFELIRCLNADPANQQYVLMCKLYVSLCQINKSVEVDYYKVRCNGDYRIIIPRNFSKATSEYLAHLTEQYTFSEKGGLVLYGELAVFDVRPLQPEIHLHVVRFDAATPVQSMVKYIEISNVLRAVDSSLLVAPTRRAGETLAGSLEQYLIFIADNALLVEVSAASETRIRINRIAVQVATIFFNEAISFIPCFKYADSEDVILFTSRNIHYLVDKAGQFNENYYGMKHELIELITSEQILIDLNDEHVFKTCKLSELRTESKTVVFFPDYLLQVQSQQQLINLLDLAIYIRNVSFFILVLVYLRRASIRLSFIDKENGVVKITGPWKEAIRYALQLSSNPQYDAIFERQFFDLRQHADRPLKEFIDVLCENFTRYQRFSEGAYQIVPTDKQKAFLHHILTADACFHFSEVGSGKTKVILPLLCQLFLSNNVEAHQCLSRGGAPKHVLVVLVPEHLVPDARAQVYRYCLSLNFKQEYRVYDDIMALLHEDVQLVPNATGRFGLQRPAAGGAARPMKQIFISSFNQFKKALTYDEICAKVRPHREHFLIVVDEVDDFLDPDKLVFNICSNKANAFSKGTLERYFEVSRAVYHGRPLPDELRGPSTTNPEYWAKLHAKLASIHVEIQDKSRSINKSFGIFNEQTLRHCTTNIAQDVEGYRSLIARPYASVNRAMPGSYYSDVERTIYLTYYILMEDVAKYDDLFQQERKFISFEYWQQHLHFLDYDGLVYGHTSLSALVLKHPETRDGLMRFLYEIILRRMEIRDRSRSVNSIDVIFNFDCVGFTGTPFIDNYPTFAFLRSRREDAIPDMIDRSFYVYASEQLPTDGFKERFKRFQGKNSNVLVEYVHSAFMQGGLDELAILATVLEREAEPWLTDLALTMQLAKREGRESAGSIGSIESEVGRVRSQLSGAMSCAESCARMTDEGGAEASLAGFNVLVDLCGVFKKTSIHEVRDLLVRHFGADRFHFLYHIDQADGADRVLYMDSDNDVQFDEEFYKHLCKTYGAALRERVFFFVDNRNVIGKDIPFQLAYQKQFGRPLFFKSVVLAHDVDDFSKIWQAMGRSRTMNATRFSIYKSGLEVGGGAVVSTGMLEVGGGGSRADALPPAPSGYVDIKELALTRQLYVHNCDRKMAGNLSSIYQTLVSLFNLSQDKFYFADEIVNVFLEKMEMTIGAKVAKHEGNLSRAICGTSAPLSMLTHILATKFSRSAVPAVSSAVLSPAAVQTLLRHIVTMKFEQRKALSGDVHDEFLRHLSGDVEGTMEISYTKQQQKQKQKQQNKSHDADTMQAFDKRNQLSLLAESDNYFHDTLSSSADKPKLWLGLPLAKPIFKVRYTVKGERRYINLYPTVQFLYSHHIMAEYISSEVRELAAEIETSSAPRVRERFLCTVDDIAQADVTKGLSPQGLGGGGTPGGGSSSGAAALDVQVLASHVRQTPQYTLAGVRPGVYLLGMKDQFNPHDLPSHPLADDIQFVADELGFVLVDKTGAKGKGVDAFGPYFVEQYILMELLSKQEVAQTVLDYYVQQKEKLQRGVERYSEQQGKGFICWRFFEEYRGK